MISFLYTFDWGCEGDAKLFSVDIEREFVPLSNGALRRMGWWPGDLAIIRFASGDLLLCT